MRAVIFDIDGTLADPGHRLHHLEGNDRNWKAFHDAMGDDPPIEAVATLARLLYKAAEAGDGLDAVLIVTARHDTPAYQQLTRDWLELHDIPHHRLYMRSDQDFRKDSLIKADLLARIRQEGYQPILVIDDRAEVVRMWRAQGIVTLQCAPDIAEARAWAGQTLLHMLVGPAGAGKSTYAARHYQPHDIISTDALRLELYGDLGRGNAPDALARVWKLAHGLIRARLEAGVFTVLDATNLHAEDRLRVLDLLPRGVFARYIVIDRDLRDKERHRDWRSEELILKHHRLFRAEEANILAGDDHPWVTVQDRRVR